MKRNLNFSLAVSSGCFFVLFTLSVLAAFFLNAGLFNKASKNFESEVRHIAEVIDKRINLYVVVLEGLRGLFAASKSVEIDEFMAYVERIGIDKNYPGIANLQYVHRVKRDQKEEFVQKARLFNPLYSGFSISPDADKEEYWVVSYVFPEGHRQILGFDVLSSSVRQEAYTRARDTGNPAMTEMLALHQDSESPQQNSFLITLPIYKNAFPSGTLKEKRESLEGFLTAAFRAPELFSEIFKSTQIAESIGVEISFDDKLESANTDQESTNLLIYSWKEILKTNFEATHSLQIGGQSLNIRFRAPVYFGLTKAERKIPVLVFGAGTLISFLIAWIIFLLLNSRAQAFDIAEQMTAELREAQQYNRNLFDQSPIGLALCRMDGALVDVNPAYAKIIGRSPDEAKALTYWRITPEKYRPQEQAVLDSLRRDGFYGPYEKEYIHRDGHCVPVRLSGILLNRNGENFILSSVEDITELKKNEAEKQAVESKLRDVMRLTPGVIYQFQIDPNGKRTFPFVSDGIRQLYEVSPEEVYRDAEVLFRPISPLDAENLTRSIEESYLNLEPWTYDFRISLSSGAEKWLRGHSIPQKSQDGSVLWNGVLTDITEKKIIESQLLQSQKMEAIGKLAGGIAHDFNNILTVMNGYSEVLVDMLEPSHVGRPLVEEIQKAGNRAADLTSQLLSFSRKQMIQPQVVCLNDMVEEMDQMIRRLITEQIELVTLPEVNLGFIKIDPGQLHQIIMNLVVNSRDAMPKGGKIILATQNKDFKKEYVTDQVQIPPGKYILLSFSDNGQGMSEEVRKRIFEPFFTTKEQGKGTGLGLATCYGIVQQAHGYMQVESKPGEGTTFEIYFPAVEKIAAEKPAEKKDVLHPRGKETILVVEDESSLREFASVLLRNLGYEVFEAENGEAALSFLKQNPDVKIDLVLTDVIMPRMGGRELAETLRAHYSEIKILFMSGYTGEHAGVDDQLETSLLTKPFTLKQVSKKIREVLDRQESVKSESASSRKKNSRKRG